MAIFILAPDPDGNCCGCVGRTSPCDPCTPSECECYLVLPYGAFIDLYGAEFSDYSTANAVLEAFVADCYAAWLPLGFTSSELSATTTVDDIEIYLSITGLINTVNSKTMYAYVPVTTAADDLVIQWTSTIGNKVSFEMNIVVRSCTGTVIDSTSSTDASGNFTVPVSAGTYVVEITSPAETSVNGSSYVLDIIVSSGSFVPIPVVGEYDDSGTTRVLEVCPKMFLPILTESTGNWYADEAAAQDAIDDNTAECIAYSNIRVNFPNFTFTPSFSSNLQYDWEYTNPAGLTSVDGTSSLNLEDGSTLTLTWSASGPTESSASFDIYDYNGVSVFSQSSTSSPITSSALPYSGRYIVAVSIAYQDGPSFISSASSTISSSSTVSVNQIQALYDVGLDCPAYLDCV